MARYEDDSDSGHTLLLTAAVVAGLLAGAVVAQRLGGWRGIRRLLRQRRAPVLSLLGKALPSGTLAAALEVLGIDELLDSVLGRRRRSVPRSRRRPAPDVDLDLELDEYEVDEFERAAVESGQTRADEEEGDNGEVGDNGAGSGRTASGVNDEEESASDEWSDADEQDEVVDEPSSEDIELGVLAAFRRHPILRRCALEIAVDDAGVLELTGSVRRERELRLARRVAASVAGVTRVLVDVAVRDVVRTDINVSSS